MATVYAFMNSKGGVGKTTLAANIGNEIAEIANRRTCCSVDTDRQCNLTQIFYASDKLGNIHPNQSIFATFQQMALVRPTPTLRSCASGQIHDALSISSLDLSKQCASA